MSMTTAKLRYEVKRLFENTACESFERNLKNGRLNVRALTRHTISDRLFQKRYETEGVDSAVTIVLDCSGSMYDTFKMKDGTVTCRMAQAVKVCSALLQTLSCAQVATSVVTYDDHTSVLKPWNMNYRKVLPMLECMGGEQGSNDYHAVMTAHQMLYARPEQRKVCFVLTDGMGNFMATREQVQSGARLGVTTIGIGINEDVSSVYPNSVRVNAIEDLGTMTFGKLKMAV
jgi:cobalamin biosynthesis protein CobT